MGFQTWLAASRPPLDLSPSQVAVRFAPVRLAKMPGGLRLAGAWAIRSDDARVSGFSGLALDRGRFLALTDSGFIVSFDLRGRRAGIHPLPAAAGNPRRKAGRDSEAIVADPLGRGWWVAFEGHHTLILYDRAFRRSLRRVPLDRFGFARNRGIEAMLARADKLIAYPEASGISDATPLPDGRVAFLHRRFGASGFAAEISIEGRIWRLPLAPYDNAEGIAAAPLADGGTRLWIVTDNDALPLRRTLLVAVDVVPTGTP